MQALEIESLPLRVGTVLFLYRLLSRLYLLDTRLANYSLPGLKAHQVRKKSILPSLTSFAPASLSHPVLYLNYSPSFLAAARELPSHQEADLPLRMKVSPPFHAQGGIKGSIFLATLSS